jgi:hypothetical protein
MDELVLRCKTHEECLIFAKNATERGHPELAQQARIYSLELRANEHNPKSELERDALKALFAYEDVLTEKNRKTTRASRTREMIDNHGMIGAIERAVNRPDDPEGFTLLKNLGLDEFAFEHIVLRYPDRFSVEAQERAKTRLASC